MDFFNLDYKIIFNVLALFVGSFELYNNKIKVANMCKYQYNSALSNWRPASIG